VVDRSKIPCFHLTQPGGCLKGADCPFNHSLQSTTIVNNTTKSKNISLSDTSKVKNSEEPANSTPTKSLPKAAESIKHKEVPPKKIKSKNPASEVNPPLKKIKVDKSEKKQPKQEPKTKQEDASKPKVKVNFGVKKLDELLQKKEGDTTSDTTQSKVGQKRTEISSNDQTETPAKRPKPDQKIESVDVELEKLEEELRNDGVDLSNVDDEVNIDT